MPGHVPRVIALAEMQYRTMNLNVGVEGRFEMETKSFPIEGP